MKLEDFKNMLETGKYGDLKPFLRMEVRNKANLSPNTYYNTIIGDIVSVLTFQTTLDDDRLVTATLNKTLTESLGDSVLELLDDARSNTPCNFKIDRLFDIVKRNILHENQNLTQYTLDYIDTLIDTDNPLDSIIVVNIDTSTRVSILQFPKLLRYVYSKIGNYYIVPSSVYEVFIIPQSKISDIDHVNEIIQYVNATTVDDKDILGHKLLKYNLLGLSEC